MTRLLVLNLPLCHWSSLDLQAPSSTDVPVLLLNQTSPRLGVPLIFEIVKVENAVQAIFTFRELSFVVSHFSPYRADLGTSKIK